jgi:hypothetical protein
VEPSLAMALSGRAVRWLTVGGLVAGATSSLIARQAPTAGPDAANVFNLQLVSAPEVKHGKVAIVEGVAGPSGQKLALGDLSVLQPVEVSIFTPGVDDDVRIELSKFILDRPARSGSTKGTASASFKFRTQGDLQIKVVSPDGPNVYRLLVWVGDEVTPEMPAPFITMEAYQKRTGTVVGGAAGAAAAASGGNSLVLWMIAGALGLIVALLAVLVLRRNKA